MQEKPTITISATNGSDVTILAERILFFWQKVVDLRPIGKRNGSNQKWGLVTQIVYATRDNDNAQDDDEYQWKVDGRETMLNPLTCGCYARKNVYRAAVDTSTTLDRVQKALEAVLPTTPFLTLHRAHTNHDTRVVFPMPSPLLIFQGCIDFVESMDWTGDHIQTERISVVGGGGEVDGLTSWTLPTYDSYAIQLTDSTTAIYAAVKRLPNGTDLINAMRKPKQG